MSFENRHPATRNLLRWFSHDHLDEGKVRSTSAACGDLAERMVEAMPDRDRLQEHGGLAVSRTRPERGDRVHWSRPGRNKVCMDAEVVGSGREFAADLAVGEGQGRTLLHDAVQSAGDPAQDAVGARCYPGSRAYRPGTWHWPEEEVEFVDDIRPSGTDAEREVFHRERCQTPTLDDFVGDKEREFEPGMVTLKRGAPTERPKGGSGVSSPTAGEILELREELQEAHRAAYLSRRILTQRSVEMLELRTEARRLRALVADALQLAERASNGHGYAAEAEAKRIAKEANL